MEVHVGRMILEQIMMAVSQVPKTKERMNILSFYKSVPERRAILKYLWLWSGPSIHSGRSMAAAQHQAGAPIRYSDKRTDQLLEKFPFFHIPAKDNTPLQKATDSSSSLCDGRR